MKQRIISLVLVGVLTHSIRGGCGKKEIPLEESTTDILMIVSSFMFSTLLLYPVLQPLRSSWSDQRFPVIRTE